MKYRMALFAMSLTSALLISMGCAKIAEMRAPEQPADMFLTAAAAGSASEIALSRQAVERSSNADVKRFAQRIITDHEKLNQELNAIADRRGVTVSTTPDEMHAKALAHLSKLSGEEFDREYMTEILGDHAKMTTMFEAKARNEKNPEVRQWAARQLPIFEQHLQMAQTINQKLLAAR